MDRCPLCGRELGTKNLSDHHLIPKTFKGKVTVRLHNVCHRKIHATFSERELLHDYFTVDRLLTHEAIQTFVKWVNKKPPEFYDGSVQSKRRR